MGAIRSLRPWMPVHWLVTGLLVFSSLCLADEDSTTPSASVTTTAPVYLPHYDSDAWSVVRGSIIGQDTSASETTYTIFCPVATPPACDLSLEFPFIIIGGPHTVKFHGTVTSTYIANVECDLNGTTAAECSGYSSYRSGYTNGIHTGPTEISWTSTLSGTDVEWGVLTLAPTPTTTSEGLGVTITELDLPEQTTSEPLPLVPDSDSEGSGPQLRTSLLWSAVATVAAVFLIGLP